MGGHSVQIKAKNTSLKQRLRTQAKMSQAAELNKGKLLESIRQGRFSEKKPTSIEVRKQKYFDVIDKNPPQRIDEIAKSMGKTDAKYGGILAAYRKMASDGIVIIWIKDDASKLPYVVRKTWLDEQQKK